jgi:OOP family OmpA-OmpF porin
MKQQLLVAALGMALVAPLAAHAEGGYVGVNVGSAEQKASVDNMGSESKSKTGYKLYGGYDFTKNFGVEAGYVDFAKIESSDGSVSSSLHPTAVYVAATGILPLNEQFSLFGKVGVSMNHTKATVSNGVASANGSDDRTTALIGVGAAYNVSKNLAVVAEYEDFGKVLKVSDAGIEGNLKVTMFSLGLRYKF